MSPRGPAFRFAFRTEAEWYVCYFAPMGTMEGKIEIARILNSLVSLPKVRESWLKTLSEAQKTLCIEVLGEEVNPEIVPMAPFERDQDPSG